MTAYRYRLHKIGREACIALTVAFRRRSLIVEMTGPILGHGSCVGLVNQYRGITPDGGRL